jgi:hypothetical protein
VQIRKLGGQRSPCNRSLARCLWVAVLTIGLAADASCSGVRSRATSCQGLPVIRFAEPLCDSVESGRKRITLRARTRTEIREGYRVKLTCMKSGRAARARITAMRHTNWRGIQDRELADDGFPNRERLLPIMRGYYPGIGLDDPATVYRWDSVELCAGSR